MCGSSSSLSMSGKPGHRFTRWLPLIAGFFVVLTVAVVSGALWQSYESHLQTGRQTTLNLSHVIQEQTVRTLQAADSTLVMIGGLLRQSALDSKRARDSMDRILQYEVPLASFIRGYFVLDTQGRIIIDSFIAGHPNPNLSDREYFRWHLDPTHAGRYISTMILGRLTGTWNFVVSHKLVDRHGRFSGVAVAIIEPHRFEDMYSAIDLGQHGLINLRHRGGELIARVPPVPDTVGKIIPSTSQFIASMEKTGIATGEYESSIDRINRVYTVRAVPDTPLILFIGVSKDELLAPWKRSAVAYVLSALLLILAVIWLTRRLMRESADREALLETLEESEKEITRHRDNLQQLVEARTVELINARDIAESANRSKSEFLANMSHELRTPMHAILSFAQLAIEKAALDEPPISKLRQYMNRIEEGGKRLLHLLNELLDLSKLESGKTIYQMRPTDIKAIAADAVSQFEALARSKNLHLDLGPSAAPCLVLCDSERIRQVFANLISNSIKFTPAGGRIAITVAEASGAMVELHQGDSAMEQALFIRINDNGIGIPPDELEDVFDKFVQSSKTRTGAGGTGLGLSICQQIIVDHGGRIWAENDDTGGTSICFLVPCSEIGENSGAVPADFST
jgi:signal transduction histidine kinase